METKPDKAVSIIECDMNVRLTLIFKYIHSLLFSLSNSLLNYLTSHQVDFDAPLGYKEPERHMQHPEEPAVCSHTSHAFSFKFQCYDLHTCLYWSCVTYTVSHSGAGGGARS